VDIPISERGAVGRQAAPSQRQRPPVDGWPTKLDPVSNIEELNGAAAILVLARWI
jgi:hypothetical protein